MQANRPEIVDFFGGFTGDCALSWSSAFNGEFANKGALLAHISQTPVNLR